MAEIASKENEQDKDFSYLFTQSMENGKWAQFKKGQLEATQKKTILGGNSTKFTEITRWLGTLTEALNTTMTGEDNELKIKTAYRGFASLIAACDNYLNDEKGNRRSAFTSAGKARINIVEEIKAYAEKDINCILVQNFQSDELKGETLGEVLGKARMRTINLQTPDNDHDHVGGAASYLTVLNESENDGDVGFYSDMKVWERGKTDTDVLTYVKKTIEQAKATDEEKKFVWDAIIASGRKGLQSVYFFVEQIKNAHQGGVRDVSERVRKMLEGMNTSMNHNIFDSKQVNVQSDTANLNARNVGMSRVAKLLGRENLIAKSEMVELREQGKENRYGSVMKKAEGEEMQGYLYKDRMDASQGRDAYISKEEIKERTKSKILPSFQRELSDLQVIDYLCGQTDRHAGNYFVKMENGKYSGVTGIDNDLSFGAVRDRMKEGTYNIIGNNGRPVVDGNENLFIPHMSRSLAINIAMLDESVVTYALADLIGKADLVAFQERLKRLKTAVSKELAKAPGESRLLEDDKWDDNTLNDFLTAEGELIGGANDGQSNYLGCLVEHWSIYDYSKERNLFEKMKKNKANK